LILDDSLGRRIAHLNGLTYTGTLGVLVRAKREGLLPGVSVVLDALRKTTMHLTPALIEMVLKEAGET
jgi:predicted nucleic acid-binding protein